MSTVDFTLPQRYFDTLRRFDRQGACRLVQEFLNDGGDVEGLFVDVLMPAMILTGEEWAADRISVAHEHYISEVTRDLIHHYRHEPWTGALFGGPIAVACCAPGERHSLGLLMISDILRAGGIDIHLLGEGAPAESIRDLAVELRAHLLCLSVALETHLPDAADLITLVRSACPNIVVAVGGRALGGQHGRARTLGADHFAADARQVRDLAPKLLESVSPKG